MKKLKCYPTYQASIDAERHREKQWRDTEQGAFESSFVSFEESKEGFYALAAVVHTPREQNIEKTHKDYIKAYSKVLRNIPQCLEDFCLVVKNKTNRMKSIWEKVEKAQALKLKMQASTQPVRKPKSKKARNSVADLKRR